MTAAPIRLLLLEDNPGDAHLVQTSLADQAPGEFAITTVGRLADALARIQTERFDAVLCDLGLPDSTGLGTAQKIIAADPALPLVVLTGSHNEDLGRAAIELGAQDYLVKGETSAPTIARTLRYSIERKRLENELHEANETLERHVAERTAELEIANTMLRASAAHYRAITQTATDAIITADTEGNIAGWNAGAERLFGYTEAEALGKPLTRLMPARYRNGHIGGMRRVLAGGERHMLAKTVEMHGLTKTATEFPMELSVSDWKTSEGQFFTGIIRDITERKLAEDALARESYRNQVFLRNASDGVHILDANGNVLEVSDSFCQMLGYSREELIGANVSLWDAQWSPQELKQVIADQIAKGEHSVFKSRHRRRDGGVFDVEVSGQGLELDGKLVLFNSARDITETKRAEEQSQRYVAQLESAFMSTVAVATTLSEMRDPYTAGHERRVAEIAVTIGAELGFDARRQEGLRVAGYLHDVGKITIPAEILAKPGKLTAVEFELIQGHAQASYDVLKGVEFPWPVAEVALQHHERMDGTGYPQGLKGDAILLEARILAVADVVEAMSSHRPYRPGLGIDKALAEIERGRGTEYDPMVADACLKLFREKGYAIPA